MIRKLFIFTIILTLTFIIIKDKSYDNPTIYLGASLPKTGVIKEWGESVLAGANAYFSYVNDNDIIKNRKIRFITYDDKYVPELAYKNTQHLIENNTVFALFGFVGTPTVKNILPLLNEYDIPFVAPFTGASFLRSGKDKNFINFRASYKEEIEKIVKYLHYTKMLNKIAVFYQNDDFGEEGYISVINSLKARDLKLVAEGNYKRNTLSIRHAFNEIKDAKPDAIIMIGAPKANALFIKKAKENVNFKNTLFCNISFGDANAMVNELDNTENLIFSEVVPNYQDSSIPIVKEYQEIMKLYYGNYNLGFISLEAYISAKLVGKAIGMIKGDLTKEKFLYTLEHMPKDAIEGISLKFKNRQLSHNVYLFKYENKKFTEIVDK